MFGARCVATERSTARDHAVEVGGGGLRTGGKLCVAPGSIQYCSGRPPFSGVSGRAPEALVAPTGLASCWDQCRVSTPTWTRCEWVPVSTRVHLQPTD